MVTIGIMIAFFSGICDYVGACVDDLSTMIPQMNETASKHATKHRVNNECVGLKLQQQITDMIKLHVDILRYDLCVLD